MHVVFPALRAHAILFDALNEGGPLELSGSYLVRENCWTTIW